MKLRQRLGALLIIIGIGFAILPFMQQAFGAYSQWQLEREWDAEAAHARSSLPGPAVFDSPIGSIVRFFSVRAAQAESLPAKPSRSGVKRAPSNNRAYLHHSITNRHGAQQRFRHVAARAAYARPMGLVRMVVPRLNLRAFVVDGTSNYDLARGPAHFIGTALPGQPGNCAIAGHRNIYGSWFRDLNLLRPGDTVLLQTPSQSFEYRVTGSRIVLPNDLSVLRPTRDATLTLVTCMVPHARNRLVVFAQKIGPKV